MRMGRACSCFGALPIRPMAVLPPRRDDEQTDPTPARPWFLVRWLAGLSGNTIAFLCWGLGMVTGATVLLIACFALHARPVEYLNRGLDPAVVCIENPDQPAKAFGGLSCIDIGRFLLMYERDRALHEGADVEPNEQAQGGEL